MEVMMKKRFNNEGTQGEARCAQMALLKAGSDLAENIISGRV